MNNSFLKIIEQINQDNANGFTRVDTLNMFSAPLLLQLLLFVFLHSIVSQTGATHALRLCQCQ